MPRKNIGAPASHDRAAVIDLLDRFRHARQEKDRNEAERALLASLKEAPPSARLRVATELTKMRRCPTLVARWLAYDADPRVAWLMLTVSSALSDRAIIEMALCKGPGHLEAIASRRNLPETVSRVLVRRGDDAVLQALARNRTAHIKPHCRQRLLERLEGAEKLERGHHPYSSTGVRDGPSRYAR
jgi:uncharacterized protein (DUF2336 family)